MNKNIFITFFIIFLTIFSQEPLFSKEKYQTFNLLGKKRLKNYEENFSSELKIITEEHSPLLFQDSRPLKQQFSSKVNISLGGENGNLLYAKEVEENSNLWLIDWVTFPDFEKPLGGETKKSNSYRAKIYIKNSLGKINTIDLFIDVIDIDEKIKVDLKNHNLNFVENKPIINEKNFKYISNQSESYLRNDNDIRLLLGKEKLIQNEVPLASEIKISTKENSPLLLENKIPIKQEFNSKVSISFGGVNGDLFYAKELEENSNLWKIDWVSLPDFEKPLGGKDKNSNRYTAKVNILNSSGNVSTIDLLVDVTDINDELESVQEKPNSNENKLITNSNQYSLKKKSKFLTLNDLTLGISEKGYYLGLAKDFTDRNQLEIGYNYLDYDISRFFDTNSIVKIKNSSFRIALRRFLNKNINKNGFYVEGSGDLAKINVYSSYSLTNEDSTYGSLSVSCSACGNLYINSQEKLNFLPSFSLGYRKKISKRITFDLRAGVQYLEEIPEFTWIAIQKDGSTYYPPFIYSRIEDEANEEINSLNKKIKELPKIIPTIGINFIYRF